MDNFKRENIGGLPFINTTQAELLSKLEQLINERRNTFVVTANPEIVMYAKKHPAYGKIIKKADFIVPDGIGIIKASQMLKEPIPDRITGYDLFLELLKFGNQNHKSAYFLGAKPEVIRDLKTTITENYPDLNIMGMHDGYFSSPDAIIDSIKKQPIDMIFIATGFPNQEEFINKYRAVNSGLWIGVGGSFDVLSGHTKRAPQFFITHHLEWFYRLMTQPTRFKRQLAIPQFLNLIRKQQKAEK